MKHHSRSRNVQVITVLVLPLLFIILGSLGYAAWSDTISTTATFTSATYDVEILDCWKQEYNGQGCTLIWEVGGKDISFTDEALFPGWQLTLFTKIHNKDQSQSWVAVINYTLYYSDDGVNWIQCNETELYNQYRIQYTGGFYLDPGPDGTWNTPDDTPMPPDYTIDPCTCVYNKQNLFFDAQDHPELSGKSFSIKVVITATYPQEEEV
jgi:hypothetical protein